MPVWHVSVATSNLAHMADVTRAQRQRLAKVAREVLHGVGRPRSDVLEVAGISVQIRRMVTAAELAITGPAIDVRGLPAGA